ncbi:MAG: DMT family transporter [Treponema phagedenis]|uniref:DMT family transporter n=1 Tax=Treponema phagedenis TaxID=162 RepID=UPI0031340AC1
MNKTLTAKQKGIICIITSAFFFAAMNLCAKSAGNLPAVQKAFFRNSIAGLAALFVVIKAPTSVKFRRQTLPFLFLRAGLGTAGLVSNFYAVSHLGLADASILAKLAPFFTILFSGIFLKEHISLPQITAAVCAFSASLLIIKPAFAGAAHTAAALIACLGGMCAGGAYTSMRYLLTHNEHPPFVVFFFSIFSTTVLLPFFIVFYTPMTGTQLILLLGAGIAGAAGQFAVTAAYSYAPANSIAVFDYTQVVFSALFGIFVFGEVPDIYSIAGYIIICSISIILFIRKDSLKQDAGLGKKTAGC